MAALTAITPTNAGAASAAAAVASTDTISTAVMGRVGAYLEVLNGNAGADTVTFTDHGLTPSGNGLASSTYSVSVPAGAARVIFLRREQAHPWTGLITVTHSVTATVTYKLYPV